MEKQMKKQKVFLTGATGAMGLASLKEILKDIQNQDIVTLARDSEKNRKILAPYQDISGLEILWGDLNDYDMVLQCVRDCDLILHIAASVSILECPGKPVYVGDAASIFLFPSE